MWTNIYNLLTIDYVGTPTVISFLENNYVNYTVYTECNKKMTSYFKLVLSNLYIIIV